MMSSRFRQRIVRIVLFLVIAMAVVIPGSFTHAQQPTVINFYDNGDTNITDWYSKTIIPAFEKQFPQYKVNFTIARGGTGVKGIVDRTVAAMQTNSDPQADLIVAEPTQDFPDTIKMNLWLPVDRTNVPNLKNVNPAAIASKYSIPYRGSQVVLAYDSDKVKDAEVPHTFPDLLKWVKANPGQFVYCRPDKGGSGGNFVQRAIYEVTGKDPSKFNTTGPVNPDLVKQYDQAWAMLSDINASVYDNGSYPAGNNPVLQLLENGSVSMATVWSDQSLQAITHGQLPSTIKLTQLTDMPFPGGYAWNAIPSNATNKAGALAFVNFLLTPEMQVSVVKDIGGFPAVQWNTLPQDIQSQFTSVITTNVPAFLPSAYNDEMVKGWYEKVATTLVLTATPIPSATPVMTAAATMAATVSK